MGQIKNIKLHIVTDIKIKQDTVMDSLESLGFHTIQVAFDSASTTTPHTMFIKRHAVKTSSALEKNTLFVVNVPCYCTETALRNIFADCGPITSVHIRERPGSHMDTTENTSSENSVVMNYIKKSTCKFKVAYVTFESADSVDIALQISTQTVRYMSTEDAPVLTGVEKWMAQYKERYPDMKLVQQEADEYMREFDMREAEVKAAEVDALEPDAEGWVTIPVKKKAAPTSKELKRAKKAEKKRRAEKELQHFYMFQQREAKRDKIATLRQQFEEDKKRIAQMQQLRKFKPLT